MRIGTRISVWYASLLAISLILLASVLYFELVVERGMKAEANKPAEPVEQEIVEVVLIFGLPTAVILLVGGTWIMNRALNPLRQLADAAEKINANTLHERLPRSLNNDELDRLADIFNEMISRIENSFGRVREFTLHASHELKTPLAVLHAGLETMMEKPSTTPEQRDELAGHLDEILRLTRIVHGLTFLAKADAGQMHADASSVQLDELVQDVYADARILAQDLNISVNLEICEVIAIKGDRHRLRQLLLNLVDNALKYNKPDGEISMALARQGEKAKLVIENTGPGIPPETLPRVFERFYRGESAQRDEAEGCGLGLSIAQWIVKSHNGEITMHSIPEGLTSVVVRLPAQS